MRRWVLENVLSLPPGMLLGLLLLGVFGSLDVAYHSLPATVEQILDRYFGPGAELLHLGILLGMVVTMLGLATKEVVRKAIAVSRSSHKV